jgi:hypothetical protein
VSAGPVPASQMSKRCGLACRIRRSVSGLHADRHARLAPVGEEVALGPVGADRRVGVHPRRKPAPLTSVGNRIRERRRHVVLVHVEHDRDPGACEPRDDVVERVQVRPVPPVDDAPGGSNPGRGGLEVCPAQPQANRVESLPGDRPVLRRRGEKPPFATRIRVQPVAALSADQPRLVDTEEPHRPAGGVHDPRPARRQPARDPRGVCGRDADGTRAPTCPSEHQRHDHRRARGGGPHARPVRA